MLLIPTGRSQLSAFIRESLAHANTQRHTISRQTSINTIRQKGVNRLKGERYNYLPHDAADIISELYLECHDSLAKYAQRIGYTKEEAEDLVQDTFEVVVKKYDVLLASDNRRSWIFGILKRCMGRFNRDTQYALRLFEQLKLQSSGMNEDRLDLGTLYRGIVSDDELELLILHFVKKRSYKSLALKYGISEPTCRKRVQRAREKFRLALGEDQNEKN